MAIEPQSRSIPFEELVKEGRGKERDKLPTQLWLVIPPAVEEAYLSSDPKRTHVYQDILMLSEPEDVCVAKYHCLRAANETLKRDRLDYSRIGFPGDLTTVEGYLTTVETCPIDPLTFDTYNINFSPNVDVNGQQGTQILNLKTLRFQRHLDASRDAYTRGRDRLVSIANILIIALNLPPIPAHDLSHCYQVTSLG